LPLCDDDIDFKYLGNLVPKFSNNCTLNFVVILLLLLLLPLVLQPTVGFGLSNNVLPIFPYLPPTLYIFSLPALEDLFLLPLSIFFWVFPFFSILPVVE